MNGLPALVRDLCLLRRGPQDMRHSPSLLLGLVVASFLLDITVAGQFARGGPDPGPRVALGHAVVLGLTWTALAMGGRQARFVQTASALIATGMVFTLATIPVLWGVGDLPREAGQLTGTQIAFGWLSLALLAWQLAVRGHILRHALELPLRHGVLVAVVFFATEVLLALAVFGGGGGNGPERS